MLLRYGAGSHKCRESPYSSSGGVKNLVKIVHYVVHSVLFTPGRGSTILSQLFHDLRMAVKKADNALIKIWSQKYPLGPTSWRPFLKKVTLAIRFLISVHISCENSMGSSDLPENKHQNLRYQTINERICHLIHFGNMNCNDEHYWQIY